MTIAWLAVQPATANLAIAQAPRVRLGNEHLQVEIATDTGAILAASRTGTSAPFVSPVQRGDILRARLPLPDWSGHAIRGSQARSKQLQREGESAATLVFGPGFRTDQGSFPVVTRVRYRLDGDDLVVSLRLENAGPQVVDEIVFPVIDAPPAADGRETFTITRGQIPLRQWFSDNLVRTQHDPFERLDVEDMRAWIHDDPAFAAKAFQYPSGFSLQSAWMHYGAGPGSVGLDVRDRTFQSQYASVERVLHRDRHDARRNERSYRLEWRWVPGVGPGETWQSPEIRLHFGDDDWHRTARQHRAWLKTWLERTVPPEAFQQSLGWVSHGLRSYDEIPVVARRAVELGAPYVLFYGWYGASGMNGLSYDFLAQPELGGAESLRRNLAAARSLGAHPLAWYNGTTTATTTRGHEDLGRHWLVTSREGRAVVDGRWSLFDPDRPPTTDDTTILGNYDMGSDAAAFNVANIRRIVDDYGFSGIELDQGAKNYASYPDGAATRSPERRYAEGARTVYEAARRLVRAHDRDGIVLLEGASDFGNQYVDTSWTFEGGVADVARLSFHRYSLPWVTVPAGVFEPDPAYVNRAFLLNCPLDLFLDVGPHPEFRAHLERLRQLKGAVHRLLFDGDFSDEEGFDLQSASGNGLLAKSYRQPDGALAVVVVNTTPAEASGALRLHDVPRSLQHHVLGRRGVEDVPVQPATPLRLGPYGIEVYVAMPTVRS